MRDWTSLDTNTSIPTNLGSTRVLSGMVHISVKTNNYLLQWKFINSSTNVPNPPFVFHCSRGVILNIIDFFGIRCLGICRPSKIDWSTRYSLDENDTSSIYANRTAKSNYHMVWTIGMIVNNVWQRERFGEMLYLWYASIIYMRFPFNTLYESIHQLLSIMCFILHAYIIVKSKYDSCSINRHQICMKERLYWNAIWCKNVYI